MGCFSGPEIATGGLVFSFDQGNTQKSWKGPPATNVIPNADIMSGWSNYYRTTASSTFITEFGTTGYRLTTQPSWNGIYKDITLSATGTYTFSAWFRYLGGSPSNNGATVYISGWGGGDSAVGLDKTLTGVWQRKSITLNCTTTTPRFYIISYGGTDNGTGNPDNSSWEVTMPQAEAGSVATPFVAGTRSTTQAILDLTRLNTITATSLTYASNGAFEFAGPGSGNYLDCGNSTHLQIATNVTLEAWVKADTSNGLGNIIQKNGNGGYRMRIENQNFWMYAGGNYVTQTNGGCTNNVWHHVVAVFSSTGLRAYVDGVLVASNSTAYNQNPTIGNMQIGTVGDSAELFDGRIDIAKVYNIALTADEVSKNFNALRGRFGV